MKHTDGIRAGLGRAGNRRVAASRWRTLPKAWLRRRAHMRDRHEREIAARVAEGLTLPAIPIERPGGVWAVTMVKDEADVIEGTVRHLVAQGVTGILVADNRSTDETPQILARLAAEVPLFVAKDNEPGYFQAAKMTALSQWARKAGADWIIPFDADELWFAPEGTLAQWLTGRPEDVIEARLFNLFPAERRAGWALDLTPHPMGKVAFRSHAWARLSTGNHCVDRPGVRGEGLRIVHMPWRSFAQFRRKVSNGTKALELAKLDAGLGNHWRTANKMTEQQLRRVWDDLTRGLGEPSIGWEPIGPTIAVDARHWSRWDPAHLVEPVPPDPDYCSELTIYYAYPPGRGWDPITRMARQAAELLDARLIEVPVGKPYAKARAASALVPRRRRGSKALVIAAQPSHLVEILRPEHWLRGHDLVMGWVIDSFLTEWIPRVAGSAHFDRLFITDGDLLDEWNTRTGVSTEWLPWGADALGLGPLRQDRPIDLLRVGHQPQAWSDDAENLRAAEGMGVAYEGRPPMGNSVFENQHLLEDKLGRAKFSLAFSNLHSPASYTHATREYLTGRWTTSLAAGASVAGIPPQCRATRELLWDGALLELDSTDRMAGLQAISEALTHWTPDVASLNRLESLRRLDWRWRYDVLRKSLDLDAPRLDACLDQLWGAIGEGQ